MFGLFKSSNREVTISDQIWLYKQSKWEACLKMATANNQCIFVAWFLETKEELQEFLSGYEVEPSVMLANDVIPSHPKGLLIFVEHYPLPEVEQALFLRLNLDDVPVLSSLDEPLFALFGGEKNIHLMKRLGVMENDIVSHPMITKSIKNAQQKIAKKVKAEKKATSQKEWLDKNLK